MNDDSSDKGIAGRRAGIDRIDGELVKLLSERARLAQEIGKLKGDGPVLRPEREAEVLRRATSANPGPLPNESLGRVFAEIVSACRALEQLPRRRVVRQDVVYAAHGLQGFAHVRLGSLGPPSAQ